MEHDDQIVVLGGGLAGLASAYTLARAGRKVQVLERNDVLGGLSRTVVNGDFRFDIGGHRWFTKKDELNDFLNDLMGQELLDVPRTSHIYFDGKHIEYPITLRGVLGKIRPSLTAKIMVDLLASVVPSKRTNGNNGKGSMRDAYVRQFGRTLYELFFEQYSQKVWGYDCGQLSGDWVVQRSRGLSLRTVARAVFVRSNGHVKSLVPEFKYPRLGIGQISDCMGQCIEANGGLVEVGMQVKEVRHHNGVVETVLYGRNAELLEAGGSHFISSIPVTELVEMLSPPAPAAVRDATKALMYRDLITVNVMLNKERVSEDTWIYIHDPTIPFGRLHEPANWSRWMVPQGKTSLVAEYFCCVGDEIWDKSDEELCELTVDCLARKLRFILPEDVLGAFAVRSRRAYPVYLNGYRDALQELKGYLASFGNMQTIGRSGMFKYNNMDHSIETGILAARNVLGEANDLDAVNSEDGYHEVKVMSS